ncbi:Ig-like domain-containing protein [Marinobacter sp. 2_MG-2023]|uniref:Ig-like domain-containing protein n=1 Tax=Marinobacter sp. 2_MG-2023 TaxID=3062679 RepID=UPI0026E47A10|nr:Ig-like domain-containing protein [Marinobacter sp. 2_MG-2023]MDO6444069.1 Ig-like domain-containing protein [Marinobacter sp. 2_MG-2023]
MKYNKILALIPALLLAACGGDEQTTNQKVTPGSVIYSYPADGQSGVSPEADIVIRFSHAITEDITDLSSKIEVNSAGASAVFDVEKVDEGRSLKLTVNNALNRAANYSVTFNEPLLAEGGRLIETPEGLGDRGVQFQTRGSLSGSTGLANTSDRFGVAWKVPASDDQTDKSFQALNFSTFRLAMTQPVHPDWKGLGGSIEMLDQNEQPVPATILVKGNRITVDPCVTPDLQQCGGKRDVLNSGETYTLKLTNLASLTDSGEGNRLTRSFSFTPRDTGPTVVLKQSATDSGLAAGEAEGDVTRSILNNQIINGVTLNSVLQGVAGPSQQTGDLFAELAFAPSFEATEALPLRIAKGSILRSTSLDVLVGGVVPVTEAVNPGEPVGPLQKTGDIKVTMTSDASGYLSPNLYTDDINAPRQITLFMDVSMNTAEAQPNASLSQDLMGVELRGIAIVKDGVLTIDAIGMVEPNLLGQEFTDSTIAFHLEAATDAESALDAELDRELDNTSPKLLSWTPGAADAIPATRQSMHRPGDPVILFFDEPLDPASIRNGVSLYANGQHEKDLHARLDGTTLILNPEGGLKQGVSYLVSARGVADLAGNTAMVEDLSFELDPTDTAAPSVTQAPPLALTTYPGFPCETTYDAIDLAAGVHGQCWDATSGGQEGDVLPVPEMPENRPIVVIFSQPMKLASIRPGETFVVEKVAADKTPIETVAGRLEKNNQRIRFFPDQPWERDAFYRYTMKVDRAAPNCAQENPTSICGANMLPLKTDLLEGLNGGGNGDNSMSIYFKGVAGQESVFTPLRNLPIRDTNANFRIDCSSNDDTSCIEPFAHEGSDEDGWSPSANTTKLSVKNNQASATPGLVSGKAEARVGCETGERCPRNKFIYQTYALNTEVKGPGIYKPTGEKGILVDLYPTMLATTSVSVFVELKVLGFIPLMEESITNTQLIRMRYTQDPSCAGDAGCPRNQLIPGAIIEGDNGQPVFKTQVELMLDAPDMEIPLGGTHDLYAREFIFDLEGDITFFDDGRMQIEQRNINLVDINVSANTLGIPNAGLITINLPLQIPVGGTYLNFITNPVKDLPAEE